MIKGLVSSGPPLPIPVPDSKNWESKGQGSEFDKVMDSKAGIEKDQVKTQDPETVQDKAQRMSAQKSESLTDKSSSKTKDKSSQDESDPKTENPPESKAKVMDPKISAQRQRAIRKFMDSFEGEFGIPPETMVDAMAQLTAQDLEKPPEKTAEAVISELKLDPQDELKAKSMYIGLLTQLKNIDTKVDLPKSTDTLLSQLSAERLQLSGEKKQFMADQVQNLNEKFFMKGLAKDQIVQPASDPKVMDLIKKIVDPQNMQTQNLSPEMLQKLQNVAQMSQQGGKISGTTEKLLAQLQKQIKAATESGEEIDLEGLNLEKLSFTPDTMATNKTLPQTGLLANLEQNPNQGFAQDESQLQDENSLILGQESLTATEGFKKSMSKASSADLSLKSDQDKVDLKSLQLGDVTAMRPKADFDLMGVPVAKSSEAVPVMTDQHKTENMQQIMNQAQALMKKGGGEVNVEMKPEGLGAIQMKLQVLDGKVQLHMNTESKEAKKMIESSLHDLKQSLAAHQLSMDHVKVDVVAQAADSGKSQNDLQNQMQRFFDQQQRDGTRQFWQQFNENFGNRQARENYYDAQNIRTGIKRQELPSISETSGPRSARSTGSSGRSLNLVA